MDKVIKQKKTDISKALFSKRTLLVAIILITITITIIMTFFFNDTVKASDIDLTPVISGPRTKELIGHGKLEAKFKFSLANEESGVLRHILVRAGELVKKNDPILILENKDLLNELKNKKFEVRFVQARKKALIQKLNAKKIREESLLDNVKLKFKLKSLDLDAKRILFDKGILSRQSILFAELEHEQASSDINHQKHVLQSLEMEETAELELMESQSALIAFEISDINRAIEELTIVSPSDGMISEVNGNIGEYIQAGTILVKLFKPNKTRAALIFNEMYSHEINKRQKITITSSQGESDGVIALIRPGVKNGTIEIEAEFINDSPPWAQEGLNIQGILNNKSTINGVFIKRPAMVENNSKSKVYVFSKSKGQLVSTIVSFGNIIGDQIEVLSGLKKNDMVLYKSSKPLDGEVINVVD